MSETIIAIFLAQLKIINLSQASYCTFLGLLINGHRIGNMVHEGVSFS